MNQNDPIYRLENVSLFEALYGKNLISLGGLEAIENMFSDIKLKKLKALDVGFGLGGVSFYLAKRYQMNISGVEICNWMVEYAKSHAPKEVSHLLNFATYNEAGEVLFESDSFDLVYRRGLKSCAR